MRQTIQFEYIPVELVLSAQNCFEGSHIHFL